MAEDREASRLLSRAECLLRGGSVGGTLAVESGRIGTPIAVRTPVGTVHSWFVPVTMDRVLLGFFEFLPDGTLARYSSFQRREDSMEGCPAVESWTDPRTITRRAEERLRSGETATGAVLSFDRKPSRLAWAVTLNSPGGTERTVFVAGEIVWEADESKDSLDSYGGPSAISTRDAGPAGS